MRQKLYDFLSSYGLAFLGLGLLFLSSVGLRDRKMPAPVNLPASEIPVVASSPVPADNNWRLSEGGDIGLQNFSPQKPSVPLPKSKAAVPVDITAVSALVIDQETGTILYSKNSAEVRPLASITKLMSALVLLDLNINFTSTTVVEEDDCDASSHHINPGEEFSLEDYWNIALVGSSNSAIKVLVRASCVTEENFVLLMNKKAEELNLRSAKFTDPTGLHSGNAANAEDALKLLSEALKKEKIAKALRTGEYYAYPLGKDKPRRVWSTDWLLTGWITSDFEKGEMAGKTGYILDSDYNFVAHLKYAGRPALLTAVLGSASNESRFTEARDLADWVYEQYLWPGEEGYDKLAE